jgi:glycosyltransferase involved in cell wall biosynthesis
VRILGTRGIPAAHGGFETFAEYLALHLGAHGWKVTCYCQEDGEGPVFEDSWQGIRRVRIPVRQQGPKGTVVFDWKATLHAARSTDLCLTLGYNTAVFGALLRVRGIPNLFNMDGMEWARAKWGPVARAWFYLNDWAGCWLGDHLIADHPEMKRHLSLRVGADKITMIPYGADEVDGASSEPIEAFGLVPQCYFTLIARAEPENSILDVVRAFSAKRRGSTLAVLGNYDTERNAYHRAVRDAASDEVRFLGAIYDKAVVQALRFHCAGYIHGHQVGGTNPSLVEALGASNPVLAHDNRFNRWVAGPSARYFRNATACAEQLDEIVASPELRASMRAASRTRFLEVFTWPNVLDQYEQLLARFLPA